MRKAEELKCELSNINIKETLVLTKQVQNNKNEEKEKGKGTVQDREHACRSLTRLPAAAQARGGSQLPAAIYPPRACKDRCMRKSAGGWMHVVISRFFADGFGTSNGSENVETESEGVKNEKK